MPLTVEAYPLAGGLSGQHVRHPPPGRVLGVGSESTKDYTNPFVYIEVDLRHPRELTTVFHAVDTGGEVPGGDYIGTAKCGPLVWHVYLERPAE
jgi:hypothetical protein